VSGCLGDRVAALADHAVTPAQRDRALAHVSSCARCRDALDQQRQVRRALASAPTPEPPESLLLALRGMPDRPRVAPTAGLVPPPPATVTVVTTPRHRSRQARPSGAMVVGALAAVGASVGLAALAAAPQAATSVPVVRPDPAQFVQDHSSSVSRVSLVGPEVGVPSVGRTSSGGTTSPGALAAVAAPTPVGLLAFALLTAVEPAPGGRIVRAVAPSAVPASVVPTGAAASPSAAASGTTVAPGPAAPTETAPAPAASLAPSSAPSVAATGP
jgi:hypothetical protein